MKLHQQFFRETLLSWSRENPRDYPWVGEKDPYLIWLSEIILQQTRVDQGKPYYLKFKKYYPSVQELAAAKEDELLKHWQGLGYYSRARNLHFSAKRIVEEYHGKFPTDYKEILSLKGVGKYTAAAISSFAYGNADAVVDGNVQRVLSRFYGSKRPIGTTDGQKYYYKLANELICKQKPAAYNQAIMDFGATQCIPKNPDCDTCPLINHCRAYESNLISSLPVKLKRLTKRHRYFHFFVLKYNGQIVLKKRTEKDIWRNLYAFPKIEKMDVNSDLADLIVQAPFSKSIEKVEEASKMYQQLLTHQKINAIFWEISLKNVDFIPSSGFQLVSIKNLNTFAFPKMIDLYLRDKKLILERI